MCSAIKMMIANIPSPIISKYQPLSLLLILLIKNMVKVGQIQMPDSWPDDMKSVAEATARAAIKAREDYGDRKLAMLHAALSFCRCVSGKPKKAGSVYVAWICPICKYPLP